MSVLGALLSGFGGASAGYAQGTKTRYSTVYAGGPGVPADDSLSLSFPAVYACVRLLSETVGTLPCITYRRDGEDRERVTDDPRSRMLAVRPNPDMTAVEFYETVMGHLQLWGNAFVYKHRGDNGLIDFLYPLIPSGASFKRDDDGTAWFDFPEVDQRYRTNEVIHFRGFGPDGISGYSPIALHRRAFSVGKAQEQYANNLWENQARPGGILKSDTVLSDVAFERMKAEWNAAHEGVSKSGKTAFLEGGVSWQQLGMPPEDAQFLEQRKFQASEIARIFRVPPHMIGDLDRSTFSNIEQQSIDFVTHSLRPWLRRLEARLTLEVFDNPQRDADLFCEFKVDALLRGDTATRYAAHAVAIEHGFETRNEARRLENMKPLPGLDEPIMPLNMAVVSAETSTEGAAAEAPVSPIFGYDLDAGIVTIDERRKQLGLDPLPNGQGSKPPVTKNAVQTDLLQTGQAAAEERNERLADAILRAKPEVNVTVERTEVLVQPSPVNVPATIVNVEPARSDVVIQSAEPRQVVRTVERDGNGDILRIVEDS